MVMDLNPNDPGLSGRRILVVGAAQGIGQATAVWLAAQGADVIAVDIKPCTETVSMAGGGIRTHILDMTDTAGVTAAVEAANSDKPLYGVVNCAGLLLRRPLDETSEEEIARQTAVNQSGTFFLARAAMAAMIPHGIGRLVLYTSQGAFTGGFNGSIPYAMNKAAVTALVKSLARHGAPHSITVNAVAPGAADTAMLRGGMSDADLEAFRRMIPMGRFADPVELAAPTAFLLSPWAGYITGTTMHVNGGQLMV
ncbi:SDR family NAD(P)-dependent oxidoreductase [Martelella soudanensis]|uniref:SDR family NAD(P)-dependent oxidoreductase n=1 Tax=unclassified Martelella TaxID=2629616 RepID=UPI0015DDD6E1|nr:MULTISPECIES: SDR family NAD(P)-dependent oxidoreductase [unclassified Martelella]